MKKKIQITITEEGMGDAIEHWLNTKILVNPCQVEKLVESRINKSSTWEVKILDPDKVIGMPIDHDRRRPEGE